MMKTLCPLVCVALLAGCASTVTQPSPFAAKQDFGYPRIENLPLPPLAPAQAPAAAAAATPVPAVANSVAPPIPAPQQAAIIRDVPAAPYDETKDPVMKALLASATQPVVEELHTSDGKLLLPPPAKLDIIDIRDISGALHAEATPAS